MITEADLRLRLVRFETDAVYAHATLQVDGTVNGKRIDDRFYRRRGLAGPAGMGGGGAGGIVGAIVAQAIASTVDAAVNVGVDDGPG